MAALREQLHAGAKSLVCNRGLTAMLPEHGGPRKLPSRRGQQIAEDARYDGKWVLRTNTELDADDVALQYKRLWLVEQWFRST